MYVCIGRGERKMTLYQGLLGVWLGLALASVIFFAVRIIECYRDERERRAMRKAAYEARKTQETPWDSIRCYSHDTGSGFVRSREGPPGDADVQGDQAGADEGQAPGNAGADPKGGT
jgi:hypothetical protein